MYFSTPIPFCQYYLISDISTEWKTQLLNLLVVFQEPELGLVLLHTTMHKMQKKSLHKSSTYVKTRLCLIENLKALLSYLNTQPKWLLLSRKSEFMQTIRLLFIVYAPLLTNLHKLSNFVAFKLATRCYLKVQQSPSTRFLDTMMLLEIKE
jgi:hypothetical protein